MWLSSLLCDPNQDFAANREATHLYLQNNREYERRVHKVVNRSWLDLQQNIH